MIVRSVTLGDLFLTDLPQQFAFHLYVRTSGEPLLFLPENPAQMMQEPCRREKKRRISEGVRMIEKKLRVNVALLRGSRQPANGGFPVAGDVTPRQIELAERILSILVSLFRGGSQPPDSVIHIFGNVFTQQIEPAKPVLRE